MTTTVRIANLDAPLSAHHSEKSFDTRDDALAYAYAMKGIETVYLPKGDTPSDDAADWWPNTELVSDAPESLRLRVQQCREVHDLYQKLEKAEQIAYASIPMMDVSLTPGDALRVLGSLDAKHEMHLITQTVREGEPMAFEVWADGCDTVHSLHLKRDGTWFFRSKIEI